MWLLLVLLALMAATACRKRSSLQFHAKGKLCSRRPWPCGRRGGRRIGQCNTGIKEGEDGWETNVNKLCDLLEKAKVFGYRWI